MTSSLRITGIQTILHWEDKRANLEMFGKKIMSITSPTEVVVLPEMFSTGFSMKPELLAETMEGETLEWMKGIAMRKKIILTGSAIIKEDGHYFNRLIWMLPNGQSGHYDKHHLFAYGDEDQHYSAGHKRLIASVNGWKLNLFVCYDLRFPVWARQQNSFEYDVLIYVANWPERRIEAWKTLLRARAIENQCYVVGVNRVGDDGSHIHYSGGSMVIGPSGEILYLKNEEEDIFTVVLDKSQLDTVREKFPFWKDADRFKIIPNSE